ncbi:hypothetical protein FDECE_13836 [Fusarium decemcellulare]|nr:hypothetical protein FDECE_13836 [Fusarium decemcellulare]
MSLSNSPKLSSDKVNTMVDKPDNASLAPSQAAGHSVPTHEPEHLVRRYTPFSVVAFAFTTTNSWVAFGTGLAVPLACGRGPGLIYGLIVAGVVMCIINAGFAELASAFPSAGGQYHIVYMAFPRSTRRVAAFFTGWVSIIYAMAGTASCNFFVANSILDTASLWADTYEIQQWHTYLVHVLLCAVAFVITARFPAAVGRVGITMFWLSITGFIASIITLLTVSKSKQSAEFVFRDYDNVSGWPDGWAVFIGITACLWAYSGVDAATHVSEEVPNPSKTVPLAIGLAMGLGLVTVVIWNIVLMFVIKDPDAIIASTVPILEVYNQALGSKVATTIWSIYYMIMLYQVVLNLFIFSGRIIWSFSRDNGLPYSGFLSHLSWGASPVRATAVALVLQIILGVLYIASRSAYSSFIGLCLFQLNITVVLPQTALLFRGRNCLPEERAFSLGRYGYLVNALSTIFVIFFSVTFTFPSFLPVTASSMNYLVVVMALGLILTTGVWYGGMRHKFTGPQEAPVQPVDYDLS